jgi:hypothetical protein
MKKLLRMALLRIQAGELLEDLYLNMDGLPTDIQP